MKSQFIFISLIVLSLNGWGLSTIQTNLSSGAIELQNSIQDDFLSYSAERDGLRNLSLFNALSSSTDKFLTLEATYDKGTPVSFQQINGVYAGLCYNKYAYSNKKEDDYYRYHPLSGALVVKEFEPEANNGPLFPAKEKKVLYGFNNETGHFSQLTAEQIIEELYFWKIGDNFKSEILSLSPLKVKTSTDLDYTSPKRFSEILGFVLYQNYIVMKVSVGEKTTVKWEQGDQRRETTIRRNEGIRYCYFFDRK